MAGTLLPGSLLLSTSCRLPGLACNCERLDSPQNLRHSQAALWRQSRKKLLAKSKLSVLLLVTFRNVVGERPFSPLQRPYSSASKDLNTIIVRTPTTAPAAASCLHANLFGSNFKGKPWPPRVILASASADWHIVGSRLCLSAFDFGHAAPFVDPEFP
jgi:hypothetical protein